MADLEGDANVNPSSLVYLKARRAIAEGDLERATGIIEEGRKRDKHSPLLAQLMARLVANEGKIREAGEILRPTYDSNPGRQNTALMFDTMLADRQIRRGVATPPRRPASRSKRSRPGPASQTGAAARPARTARGA